MSEKIRISRKKPSGDKPSTQNAGLNSEAGKKTLLAKKRVVKVDKSGSTLLAKPFYLNADEDSNRRNDIKVQVVKRSKPEDASPPEKAFVKRKKTAAPVKKKKKAKRAPLDPNLTPVLETEVDCLQCGTVVKAQLKKGSEAEPENKDIADKLYWVCPTCDNNVGAKPQGRQVQQTFVLYAPKGTIPTADIKDIRFKVFLEIKRLSQRSGLPAFHVLKEIGKRTKVRAAADNLIPNINSIEQGESIINWLQNDMDDFAAKKLAQLQLKKKAEYSRFSKQYITNIEKIAENLGKPVGFIYEAIRKSESPFEPSDIQTKEAMVKANKWLKDFYKEHKPAQAPDSTPLDMDV